MKSSSNLAQKPLAISLFSLAEKPEWIPVLAQWHHGEWLASQEADMMHAGSSEFEDKLQRRKELLEQHCNDSILPFTLVAALDDEPIGSASLVKYQFTEHQLASDWLTNVFVLPEHRHHGVATKLINSICDYAQNAGIESANLYTADKSEFYKKLGWSPRGNGRVQGQMVSILCRNVRASI